MPQNICLILTLDDSRRAMFTIINAIIYHLKRQLNIPFSVLHYQIVSDMVSDIVSDMA